MIYLHIGRHKSGTSSIQQFMARNRDALLSHRFCYPDCAPHQIAHHPVANAIKSGNRSTITALAAINALKSDKYKGFNFILSSEAFQNVRPDRATSIFPVGETTIVVYIREQLEYLISSYLQQVQSTSLIMPLNEYMRQRMPNFNYDNFLRGWADQFGADFIKVRIFDKNKLVGGDVVLDFCSQLGLDVSSGFIEPERFWNPSLTYPLALLKLFVNRHLQEQAQKELRMYNFFEELASSFVGRSTPFPVRESIALKYRNSFHESNLRLARTWFEQSEAPFDLKPIPKCFSIQDSEVMGLAQALLASSKPSAKSVIDLCLRAKGTWADFIRPEFRLVRRLRHFLEKTVRDTVLS